MKFVLLLILAMPLTLLAQDCKLIKETDPYTKERTISTGFIPLTGASLSIDARKDEVDLLFSVLGADRCFTDASTAAIFFVGSKVKQSQRNGGSMNCEGLFHIIFRNTATPAPFLRKMATQKIEKIIFTGTDKKEITISLDPDQQQVVMELAACIVKEAPALLQ
jgi:hypothetical protein